MIFVAAGTHHQPFDRLVRAAATVAGATEERIVLQRGCSTREAPGCEVHDQLPPERFEALLREARVVVLHGGSSSFLQARALGHRPIVVPRDPSRGEHVDDHQIRFVRSLGDAVAWVEAEALPAAIRASTRIGDGIDEDARSRAFCASFGVLVDALCGERGG